MILLFIHTINNNSNNVKYYHQLIKTEAEFEPSFIPLL